MINLRERLVHELSNMVVNERIHEEINETFEKLDAFLSKYIQRGSEADDVVTGIIAELEDVCFKAGANMALDFVAGKDVE